MAQLNSNGAWPPTADPYADDPFFKRHSSSTWNACIGEQGDEENYLDGYIEAAMELAASVIDKKMFGKRDTLVLPILYNARHAVELVLKFATFRLVKAGLLPPGGRGPITILPNTGKGSTLPRWATKHSPRRSMR